MNPSPKFLTTLACLHCGQEYPSEANPYVCGCRSNRGSDLGVLEVQYNYTAIQRVLDPAALRTDPDRSIGRYWPLLPIGDRHALPPLAVGNTPLIHAPRLAATLNLPNLYLKDDGRNPSASLKDRASAIAVARAQADGASVVATASTGNAAAALATLAAAAGQPNVIFVPKSAPPAKIAQLLVYGSTVLAIDGTYDQAYDLCVEVCHEFGWYNRNTGYNPFMTEGKKTVAFEIAEQLAVLSNQPNQAVERRGQSSLMQAPDAVFVSVGDGCILGGVHKGFKELLTLGWIDRMPRLYGVQSTQSAAIYQAWRSGQELPVPVRATTRADSISVDAPRDATKALRAARQSNGAILAVPDEELMAAILPLARLGAVFAEPAGATAFAGLVQAMHNGLLQPSERVVVINTGSGLKDVQAATQVAGGTTIIEPTLQAVKRALFKS